MNRVVTLSRRLWYGLSPELRKSRFHTQKGEWCLSSPTQLADLAAAVGTGLLRKGFGFRPVVPWLTFPAIRFLRGRIRGSSKVFEWGSGMSTLWFERRCAEVWAVEDDPGWCATITRRARKAKVVLRRGRSYIEAIEGFPAGYFDVISVDGSHRVECFRRALTRLPRGGVLIVDNTDNDRTTHGDLFVIDQLIEDLGSEWKVHRFPGWGPGNFFAWETTVCVRE